MAIEEHHHDGSVVHGVPTERTRDTEQAQKETSARPAHSVAREAHGSYAIVSNV